jgi:sugar diacid utilization regulator
MASDRSPSVSELARWLQAVAQISAAVNTNEPLGNVLDAVAETTCRLLRYDFSAVLLVDEAHERLLITGAHGLSESYIASVNSERPFRLGPGPYGEGPSSRAFRSREPVTIRDAQIDPAFVPWAGVAVEQGYRSLAAIPLVVSGEAIGTLNCYTRSVHEFSPEELLLLETMANQAAAAITAARLHEQEQATIKRLEEARGSLEAQTHLLERSEEIHAELTGVVLADSGLAAIAAALARILSGSVVIAEPAGTVLAAAAFGAIPTGLAEIVGDPAALAARLLEPREPVELRPGDDPAVAGRTFVAPVTIGREVVARLWVLQPTGDLGALERRALEHGATVVALELLKQRIASAAESKFKGELLYDLIDGRLAGLPALDNRARYLAFDLSNRFAILVVQHDPEADQAAPDGAVLGDRHILGVADLVVRRLHHEALIAERDGQVVLLLSEATRQSPTQVRDLADAIRREIRRGAPRTSVSISAGPWVTDPREVARSYDIARSTMELAKRANLHDRTIIVSDLGVAGLLLSAGTLNDLAPFSSSIVDPIRVYDDRRGGDLLATLRVYLDKGCSTAETARALVVHPNTVAYRISRIRSILGIDPAQPDAFLRIQLALIIDQVGAAQGASRPVTASQRRGRTM